MPEAIAMSPRPSDCLVLESLVLALTPRLGAHSSTQAGGAFRRSAQRFQGIAERTHSGEGDRFYEKYLETCSRAEVDPMEFERWELLQK